MKIKFNTIRFKISVLYVAILGIILITYSVLLYVSVNYIRYSDLEDELDDKTKEVGDIIKMYINILGQDQAAFISAIEKTIRLEKEGPGPGQKDLINAAEARWLRNVDRFDLRDDYISLLDKKWVPIRTSNNFNPKLLSLFPRNLKLNGGGEYPYRNVHLGKLYLRIFTRPYDFGNGRKYLIQVGTSLAPIRNLLQSRLISIAISIPIVLLLASFVGHIFALRILAPVVEITKTAEKITYEDLGTRIKTKYADEEMKYLVQAFNDMISRLEKSFKYIEEFSAHAAHELKTPLAIIHGESEVALRSPRLSEEYQRVIQVTLEESERMIKVVEDMLLLTRLEYESEVFKFAQLDLVEFLRDICEHSKILGADKQLNVNAYLPAGPVAIRGDQLHLRRLFFNLIDNAKKFSPYGGTISVQLKTENSHARVSVSDHGAGIDKADLPKIFGKFFRRDPISSGSSNGTGLGLSLALSIAKAHHGDIEVQSHPGKGSTFIVILPTS